MDILGTSSHLLPVGFKHRSNKTNSFDCKNTLVAGQIIYAIECLAIRHNALVNHPKQFDTPGIA
jgi:hypothetical protein